MRLFEKFAAFFFLVLLVGMVGFLTFVPLPESSEKVILMIIGGLMTAATGALPKLFGAEDTEKEKLRDRVRRLEEHVAVIEAQYKTLEQKHSEVISMLIDRHVVKGEGLKLADH